jgi:hypothetical protein
MCGQVCQLLLTFVALRPSVSVVALRPSVSVVVNVLAIRPSVSVVVNVLAIRFRHRASWLRVLPFGLAMPALQCELHMFSVRRMWR